MKGNPFFVKDMQGNYNFIMSKRKLKSFLAIITESGYASLPQEDMHWQTRNDTNNRLVSSMMSREEFEECKRYLHLCHNDHLDKNGKFFKTDLWLILLTNNVWKTTYQSKTSASMSPWFHILENVEPSSILMASLSSLAIKCGLWTSP